MAMGGCVLSPRPLQHGRPRRGEGVQGEEQRGAVGCLRLTCSLCFPQVSKEEETDENETEWLMEEIQLPAPRLGREGQENGHITTKSVKAEALTSLHGDDQDSEDEVLTIPEVKVHTGRGAGAEGSQPVRSAPRKAPREREDDRVGLVRGEKARKGKPRPGQQKPGPSATLASFHDDSDEDLLHI